MAASGRRGPGTCQERPWRFSLQRGEEHVRVGHSGPWRSVTDVLLLDRSGRFLVELATWSGTNCGFYYYYC